MLRRIAHVRRHHADDDTLRIVARILAQDYDWLPPEIRRRTRLRHAWLVLQLLPDVEREVRRELRLRWARSREPAASLVADRARAYVLMAGIAAAAGLHAMARPTPFPAVRLRRLIRPVLIRA